MSTRIGFCSAGGTGKTTLLNPLSLKLGLDIKNLTTQSLMSEFHLKNQNDAVSVAGVVPDIGIQFQTKLINNRTDFFYQVSDMEGNDEFVSDRTPLDSLAYYMIHNSYWDTQESTQKLIDKVKESSQYFDYVFMLPTKVIPVENNGVRGLNPEYHELVQNTIKSLAPSVNYKLIEIPAHVLSVEDRVNWIGHFIMRDKLLKLLRKEPFVNIKFKKKDGSIRDMKATLNPDVIKSFFDESDARSKIPVQTEIDNSDNIAVIDMEKNDWRSFNISTLLNIGLDRTPIFDISLRVVDMLLNTPNN